MSAKKTKKKKAAATPKETGQAERKVCGRHSMDIGVGLLVESPYQTRKRVGDIEGLAASILQAGIICPVTVREIKGGKYELVAGHRRAVAAKTAGLASVPAIVLEDCDDQTAAELCVTENMQRSDLTPMEEAHGVAALLATGHTAQDVADRLGRSRQWVALRANLLNLNKDIQKQIDDPESRFSVLPIAGLELIATLPEAMQKMVANMLQHSPPTVAHVKRMIGNIMGDLGHVSFDTGACAKCLKRTGAQPDLFDVDGGGELGMCLDSQCRNEKTKRAIVETVQAAKKEAPKLTVFTDSYNLQNMIPGVVGAYSVSTCKKSDKGAMPALKISDDGTAKKVWIRKPDAVGGSDGGGAVSGPTKAEKAMAKEIKAMVEWVETEGNIAAWLDDHPFDSWIPLAMAFGLVATTFDCKVFNRLDAHTKLVDMDAKEIAKWFEDGVRGNIAYSLRFERVTGCEDVYRRAVSIDVLFGLDGSVCKPVEEV